MKTIEFRALPVGATFFLRGDMLGTSGRAPVVCTKTGDDNYTEANNVREHITYNPRVIIIKGNYMTRSMLNRYEREQNRLLVATLPTCGIVEYDNLLPRVATTGRTWNAGVPTLTLTRRSSDRRAS